MATTTSFVFLLALAAGILPSSISGMATPKSEEKADGCGRITAALGYGNMRYLFFGNTYIQLDQDFNQIGQGDSHTLVNAPHPDAAFMYPDEHITYIFSDQYVFSFWSQYLPEDAANFANGHHWQFFQHGLDAAGNLEGTTIFFKDCQFVLSLPMGMTNPAHLPYGYPCHLDAAMTVGKELWLFKDDKLWQMTNTGLKPGMPVETSSVIHLNDTRLCVQGEVHRIQ